MNSKPVGIKQNSIIAVHFTNKAARERFGKDVFVGIAFLNKKARLEHLTFHNLGFTHSTHKSMRSGRFKRRSLYLILQDPLSF